MESTMCNNCGCDGVLMPSFAFNKKLEKLLGIDFDCLDNDIIYLTSGANVIAVQNKLQKAYPFLYFEKDEDDEGGPILNILRCTY